jgi:hypothetical protein
LSAAQDTAIPDRGDHYVGEAAPPPDLPGPAINLALANLHEARDLHDRRDPGW